MGREPVAAARPALGTAESEHAGVLARAVVLKCGRILSGGSALELVLARGRFREQAADGRELLGRGKVGRGRDRDLLARQVVACANERKRLEGLRRGTQIGDAVGVARLLDHGAVAHRDRMHEVRGLVDITPVDDYPQRLHPRELRGSRCKHSWGW